MPDFGQVIVCLLNRRSELTTAAKKFMWVEVVRWSANGDLRGMLMSEPRSVRALRAGQEVTIAESDFYDYLRSYAEGTTEGSETGKILQQRSGSR